MATLCVLVCIFHVENSPETWRTRLKLEFRMRSLSLSTKSIALDYDKCRFVKTYYFIVGNSFSI